MPTQWKGVTWTRREKTAGEKNKGILRQVKQLKRQRAVARTNERTGLIAVINDMHPEFQKGWHSTWSTRTMREYVAEQQVKP